MANPMGESNGETLRLDFDRRLTLQFRGSVVTSDAGLLAYRELDDALGLSDLAGERLADARTGKNGRHALVGMLRQAVFGRLAGYEDVNDAERLRHDPAMRWIVGGKAAAGCAASASQIGRLETRWLASGRNLSALADLSGQWIDKVHARRPPRGVVLDMDSSVSPTHGEQEMSVWNGHYECTCYHPLFVFNQFGDVERCALRPGNVHSADGWEGVLEPVVARYRGKVSRIYFRADAGFANPDVYGYLEAERIKYAIRLPANRVLQERIGYLLKRPVGRPSLDVRRSRTSPIRREAGRSPAASSPRSNGIRASCIRASASSSPTWRGRPRTSSLSTTSAAPASSGSKRARAQSDGRACHAAHSPPTPSVSSFTRSPIISATSCARWRRPNRSKTGR
jgi:Transposase DDE domain group 1